MKLKRNKKGKFDSNLSSDLNSNLNSAISLFQSGKLDNAQELLKDITRSKKAPAISWFLSAIIHVQKSEYQNAVNAFKKAIALQPIYPDAHNNLGVVLEIQNQIAEATKHYQKAVQQRPNYANALFNLGNINHSQGDLLAAEKYYLEAIKSDPQYIKVYNNLGLLYQQTNKLSQARTYFQNALKLSPNDFEILNNMGQIFHLENNNEKALAFYQESIHLHPDNPEALNNSGIALHALQRYEEAEHYFQKAIHLRNNYAEAYSNMANLYKDMGNSQRAKENYLNALKLNPLLSSANNNYGLLLHREGQYDTAKNYFEAALKGDNTYKEAHYNLGTNQLATGNFEQGWKNYLYRPTIKHALAMDINKIKSSDLANKHILLLKEQGIGDELFFLRFSKQMKQLGSTITYLATPKISEFVRQISWLDKVIEDESHIKDYDLAISIADLPALLVNTKLVNTNENIPPSISLEAASEYIIELQDMLARFGPPPYIGITWRGGQKAKDLLYKSIPIDQLLHSIENVSGTFISLQRLPTSEELNQLKQHPRFATMPDLSDFNEDLPRMLSLLSLLDEYVGVSNTNMHLRAALGKTAQVLIPHPPEWRWMLISATSPWFPGFDVLRQSSQSDWSDALTQLSTKLQNKYGRST